jgi:hypothetical protein
MLFPDSELERRLVVADVIAVELSDRVGTGGKLAGAQRLVET